MGKVSLSVVIPAFNEAHRLPSSLPVLSDALRALSLDDAEVIVVDDGSVDDTAEIAAELLRDLAKGRVISLPSNNGKGAAVRAGVAAATGEAIVFMDADLASDVSELPALLAALQDAEVALGSRRLGHGVDRAVTRRVGSWAFHGISRLLVPLGLADTQCGFKAFRHAEAKILFDRSEATGFGFDVEVLAIARSLDYRIAEVPVRWIEKPDGTFRAGRHTPAMLVDLLRARRHITRAGQRARVAGLVPAGPPRGGGNGQAGGGHSGPGPAGLGRAGRPAVTPSAASAEPRRPDRVPIRPVSPAPPAWLRAGGRSVLPCSPTPHADSARPRRLDRAPAWPASSTSPASATAAAPVSSASPASQAWLRAGARSALPRSPTMRPAGPARHR
ncbi:glycosyltransferase [Pseudofrankia sp. BMG5.37]|nr:glycosyltransferase [Pseudofrankia sp. BMG5.37]